MNCATFQRLFCCLLVWGVSLIGEIPMISLAENTKPNVLLILCDDVGWGEFGFQGNSDIPTPRIDSIASNGVTFSQGYVSCPVCSPTRAGLMTGRYQTRFGHESNSRMKKLGLDVNEKTIADRLKPLGYATCAIGKWHLGERPKYHPLKRGFDEFFGTLANTSYFHPALFVDSRISPKVMPIEDDEFYTTEQFGIRAADWIEKHQHEPWFVYLPFNAQHNPLQAPQSYLDRCSHIQDPKRRAFAAMMTAMDDNVGRALDKIHELGQEEKTMIIFLSDNGGPTKSTTSSNGPLKGLKAMTWEGGIRVPFCMQWKGHLPAKTVYQEPVIQLDLLPTIVTVAGGTISPEWKLDGVNLLPYLTSQNAGQPHESLFWRYGDQWAVRHGNHKLVVAEGGSGQPELYDLVQDKEEQHDLAAQQPEKVKELQAVYAAWNAEQAPPSAPIEPKIKN
ncbi:MAG TPA: sulfatase-like hydrolase/transferase [Planctomicrobium sp.]|nr:sulfatase-like hydrolase/transferase [Planctomicrobium sp.]